MESLIVQVFTWALATTYGPYVLAVVGVLGGLVAIASVIAPFTTTPKDDEAVTWMKSLLQRLTVIKPKE